MKSTSSLYNSLCKYQKEVEIPRESIAGIDKPGDGCGNGRREGMAEPGAGEILRHRVSGHPCG